LSWFTHAITASNTFQETNKYKSLDLQVHKCENISVLPKPVFVSTKIPNVRKDDSSNSSHNFHIYPLQISEDALAILFLYQSSTGVSRIAALH